jgi:tetratricopeptide (TPR) repeat protein/tRNA A-37 threonylcarbamoyl transferase component Bud32
MKPAISAQNQVIAGEFTVERRLGRGGFGRVDLVTNNRSGESYAAKQIREPGALEQRRLLVEAQRWIGLPAHPHITGCSFVRSVGDSLIMFCEYVPGHSLAGRIESGSLYAGEDHGLRTILATAAQLAWGVDTAHRAGVLHLDLKPANVLYTHDGVAKITDFGLAAAVDRSARHTGAASATAATPLGFTTAYASPEQAEGRPVGRAADVWSWAATVLEMFLGRRPWISGTVAGFVLDRVVRTGGPQRVAIPAELAGLLRRCFELEPAQRPRSLGEVAGALHEIFPDVVAEPPAEIIASPSLAAVPLPQRAGTGVTWPDPWPILELCREAAGLGSAGDPPAASVPHPGARRVDVLNDLHVFEEGREILLRAGTRDEQIAHLLVVVYASIATVKSGLGDRRGTVRSLLDALTVLNEGEDTWSRRWYLPKVYLSLAENLPFPEQVDEALHACSLSVVAAGADGSAASARDRGRALKTRAELIWQRTATVSEGRSMFRLCDRAIDAFRKAGDVEGEISVLDLKAAILVQAGRPDHAARTWTEARAHLSAMDDSDPAVRSRRAILDINQAARTPDPVEAAELAAPAVHTLGTLAEHHGDVEFLARLGYGRYILAGAYHRQFRTRDALETYRAARTTLETSVVRDGHREAVTWLADCQTREAMLVRSEEGAAQAVHQDRRAVELWQRIGEADGKETVALRLAGALRQLGVSLTEAGDFADAEAAFDEAASELQWLPKSWSASFRRLTAEIHSGRALLDHHRGDEESALTRLRFAAEVIRDAVDEGSMTLRLRIARLLAGMLEAAGRHLAAADVLHTITDTVDKLVRKRVLPARERAELRCHLTEALLTDGRLDAGLTAARQALAEYERLDRAGAPDATPTAAKAASYVGSALIRLGDLPGAAAVLQPWLGRLLGEPATANHPLAARMAGVLVESRQLMSAEATDLPVILAAAEKFVATASRRAESDGPAEFSGLLEDLFGKVLWLKDVHPEHVPDRICAEIALRLGITACRGNRTSAADRGLRYAQESFSRLVAEHGQDGPMGQWLETHEWRVRLAMADGNIRLAQLILHHLLELAVRVEPHRQDQADRP